MVTTIQSSPIEVAARNQTRLFIVYVVVLVIGGLAAAALTILVFRAGNSYQSAVRADADARIAEAGTKAATANAEAAKANEGLGKSNAEIARLTKEAEKAKAERAEADKQIAIAKADAAKAKEGMANAEARSLEAQHRAVEASAKAEAFRLDIAKANERAAEANRIAEGERLARVKIEQRLADRAITDADAAKIIERMKPYRGHTFQVVTFWDDREPLATAQRLADVLVAAGWKLDQPKEWQGLLGGLSGVQVFFHPEASAEAKRAAEALVSALNAVGLSAVIKQMNAPGQPTEKIHINVGTKP